MVAYIAGYSVLSLPCDGSMSHCDLTLTARDARQLPVRPKLDILCRDFSNAVSHRNEWRFPLAASDYNALCEETIVPRILVLLLLPEDVSHAWEQNEEQMILHGQGYWLSLEGATPNDDPEAVKVSVPKKQVFAPDTLQGIMRKVKQEGTL